MVTCQKGAFNVNVKMCLACSAVEIMFVTLLCDGIKL